MPIFDTACARSAVFSCCWNVVGNCMDVVGRGWHVSQLSICLLVSVSVAGCCGPLVLSHRFPAEDAQPCLTCDAAGEAGEICECRHIVDHFVVFARAPHRLLPGAVRDRHGLIPLQPGEAARDVPHSKFHPVPIRPVFMPRISTAGSEPSGAIPVPLAERAVRHPQLELVPAEPERTDAEPTPAEAAPPPPDLLPPAVE